MSSIYLINYHLYIFLPSEAATILKIPISYRLPDDQLVWIGNKSGSFIVKSAYYIAMRMVDDHEIGEGLVTSF